MNELINVSNDNQLRLYFEKIIELSRLGIKYPSNLDDVWMLVYERKDNAYKALKETFIETDDYELRQNAKVVSINEVKNGVKTDCFITVQCLEFFIARKIRRVFDVYRSVFHQQVNNISLPNFNDPADAAIAWAEQYRAKQLAETKVKELAPKAIVYDLISDCTNLKTVADVAKEIGTGRNRLFEFLREKSILMATNLPYQKYIDSGYFIVKTNVIENLNKSQSQTYFTSKGEVWIASIFK